MATRSPHTEAYRKIAKQAANFAKMVEVFERTSSSEFLKSYPDYDYDGTDYVCRHAELLADQLRAYTAENLSGDARALRSKQPA